MVIKYLPIIPDISEGNLKAYGPDSPCFLKILIQVFVQICQVRRIWIEFDHSKYNIYFLPVTTRL